MAISNLCVWEVRSTGNDANGGGFVTGASGTDFSQQDTAQFALTGVTSAGAGSTFLDASAAASMVGNICRVVSGTNFTTGLYQIISVVAGVSVTVDRAITTGVGSAGVINIGGGFATIQTGLAAMTVEGQTCYVKSATYTITVPLSFASTGLTKFSNVIGYGTVRGDAQKPTISTSAAISMLNSSDGWIIRNFIFVGGATATKGIDSTSYTSIVNCDISGINGDGVAGRGVVLFTRSANNVRGFACSGSIQLYGCIAQSNSGIGFALATGGILSVSCCVASGNGSHGIQMAFNGNITSTLCYGNGGNGVDNGSLSAYGTIVANCIFAKNTLFGYSASNVLNADDPEVTGNGYWSNGSGAVNNCLLDARSVSIPGVDPVNDPFVSKATGNFALNNIAGAGALLRNVGFPGTIGSTVGYADIGPFRHQDPAGAAGIIRNPEL